MRVMQRLNLEDVEVPKFHQPKLIIWAVASHDAEGQVGLRLHLGAMLMLLHRSVDGLQATSCCDQSLGTFDSNVSARSGR